MKTKSLFLLIAIFPFIIFAKEPDPNCPLDYFYLGYDLVKGNPVNDGTDPGWRYAIMSNQSDKMCFTCVSGESCKGDYIVYDMHSEIDYYNNLSMKVGISSNSENFLYSTAFTASAEYQYQQEDIFGLNYVNVQAEGSCQLYGQAGRDRNCYDLVFTTGFSNSVAAFPTTISDPDWFNKAKIFFNDYGTHTLASAVSLGARWSFESILTKADYEAFRAVYSEAELYAAAELAAEYYRTDGASIVNETDEQTEIRVAFELASEKQSAITVGALPPTDISFGEWANNIENPIPQSFRLAPISELFTPNFFPSDTNIGLKREVMEAAYLLYCDSVPGCGEPKPPKIVRMRESAEGKYQTYSEVSVSCPVNYQLISGGCRSEPMATQDWDWWMLPSLKPEGNSYHCISHMDYHTTNTYNYYRGVEASATCLHNDYIEEIEIVPCEGPTKKSVSECMATCSPGFMLTGGGCESDSATEKFPWKVVRSTPVYNGIDGGGSWNCRVTEDGMTSTYDKKAMGYAVCVRYPENTLIDQKIFSDKSGTQGYLTNGIDVLCDPGYEILSGGCINPVEDDPTHEWKIVETLPIQNQNQLGWSCLSQADTTWRSSGQIIQTDALCARFR